jgi:hypothetical protein
MMNTSDLNEFGDNKITYYQKFVIVLGVILLCSFTFLSIISDKSYYYYFPIIIAISFLVIIILYSRIYSVKYNTEYFYLSNFFKNERIDTSHFIEIKKVKLIDFLFFVVFKEKRFLIMIKSEDIIKNFFILRNKYAEELTQNIKKTINTTPLD